jgi:potassium-transporting ATPase KdpC subunit
MKRDIFTALKLTLVCLVLFSCIYTLLIFGIAQLAPNQGEGRMISTDGRNYYEDIGQSFNQDKYFNSRPSAAGYNSAVSAGSNKGPSNPDYLAQVDARIDSLIARNPGLDKADISSDMVTASASGLDPDISVRSAMLQVPRIAKARSIPEATIVRLVQEFTTPPWLGMFGPEKINVLKINIALNKLATQ